MSHHFNLCPECLTKYQSLRFVPDAKCWLCSIPLSSLVWSDEHPGGKPLFPHGHEQCRDSIIRLSSARTALWRSGSIPENSKEVWDEARQVIADWPGFQRLSLNEDQMKSLDACREELDELMGLAAQHFGNISITNEGGGLSRWKATRDPQDGSIKEK